MKSLIFVLLLTVLFPAVGAPSSEVVCSYAPSQSKTIAAVIGAIGGVSAIAGHLTAVTGLTAVAYSSGALILTGSSGYMAGTLGAGATAVAAAPFFVAIGLVVGGSTVSLELVCASRNHPEQLSKVISAAAEFSRRFDEIVRRTQMVTGSAIATVTPATGRAALVLKQVATDVWEFVYQARSELTEKMSK